MSVSTKVLCKIATAVFLCAVLFCITGVSFAAEEMTCTLEEGTILTLKAESDNTARLAGISLGESVTDLNLPGEIEGKVIVGVYDNAFQGCDDLKTLYLPASIAENPAAALENCPMLSSITVDPDNPNLFSLDGVLFQYGSDEEGFIENKLLYYPPEKTDTYYMMPLGVRRIDCGHFRSNHMETLEFIDHLIYEGDAERSNFPALDTVVFCREDPVFPFDRSGGPLTIVLGSGDMLENFSDPEACIVSYAGSEAEGWAEERGYSFKALPKSQVKIEARYMSGNAGSDYRFTEFIDTEDSYKVKITSDLPFETSSVNENVAVMDQNGNITVNKPGKTYLHAFIRYDGNHLPADRWIRLKLLKTFNVMAENTYVVKSGTKTVQLLVNDKYPGVRLSFMSWDESNLTVDRNGKVTLLTDRPGTYVVEVFNKQETDMVYEGSTICYVSIDRFDQTLTVPASMKMVFGKKKQIKASAKTELVYESLTPKTATVNRNGIVSFLHPGTAVIQVTAGDSLEYKGTFKKVRIKCTIGKPRLKVKTSAKHSAKITWSKVPGADKYFVYVKAPGSKKYKLALKKSSNVKSVTHKNLKKGKKYSYKVRAVVRYKDKTYFGPYSKAVTVKAQ